MSQLEDYRLQIDRIDLELLKLLMERKEFVDKILQYKVQNDLEIHNPQREQFIITDIMAHYTGDEIFKSHISEIFLSIIKNNRNYMIEKKSSY